MSDVINHEFEVKELHAREECETLAVVGRNGKPDHWFNQQLKDCYAHDKRTGAVSWQQTLDLRKKLIDGYEKRKERG